MKKRFPIVVFFFLTAFNFTGAFAQADTVKQPPVKVGIFAPLYLDSVFSNNTFRYKQSMPRFIAPAVDFVRGTQLALDSLQSGNDYFEATIYDSKSFTQPVSWLIQNKKLDSLQLIIGSVKDAEFLQLAGFALQKNIPFISATYPNDAGITKNPFLVIVNSTLRSHCEAIYSYILQKHGTDKIYLCRQKGVQEDMVASYFKLINEQEGKPLLPIETINLDNNLTAAFLKTKLDSNGNSVLIGASLDETFAGGLSKAAYELRKSYPITLIGMPNWDGFAAISKKNELADFPVYYTSPYFNSKTDETSKWINENYKKKYKAYPGDMVFKGFESVYFFARLQARHGDAFMNNINDRSLRVISDFNFRPVMLKKDAGTPDYFENKHLYFIRMLNGTVSKTW
ncbi:MAG TPA: ABC transporter substrate-binding protein [Ferruginibacter sp.]|nr:ABC transporter substrate-binding protein [Ferruginibacter sp.]